MPSSQGSTVAPDAGSWQEGEFGDTGSRTTDTACLLPDDDIEFGHQDGLASWLMPNRSEGYTECYVLVAAARHDVFRELSRHLKQRHGQTLLDHLERLDKGVLPDDLSRLNLMDLDAALDDACRLAAQYLKERAFQNPSEVISDAYEWAVRAVITAVRYHLADTRKIRREVDFSDLSQLWKLWLPR
jgi:hypothetical protein